MLKWFIHPETKEKIEIQECIEKGLLREFYPTAYLINCSEQRPWTGKASTTQLISGLRAAYLKIIVPYAECPDQQAFRILGTKAHKGLELSAPNKDLSEIAVDEAEVSMIADSLEEFNGEWDLTDYKTSGSFKVMKVMGLGKIKKKRPMFDESGNPVLYKKSGKWGKAGDQKMEEYSVPDEDAAKKELFDWAMQLNNYRVILNEYFDILIKRMRVFITARDGNTSSARSREIYKNTYFLKLPFYDDEEVKEFFKTRSEKLKKHMEDYFESVKGKTFSDKKSFDFEMLKESCPPECDDRESWNGRKCNGYCPVAETCKKLGCSHLEGVI